MLEIGAERPCKVTAAVVGLQRTYARLLIERGYLVDSVRRTCHGGRPIPRARFQRLLGFGDAVAPGSNDIRQGQFVLSSGSARRPAGFPSIGSTTGPIARRRRSSCAGFINGPEPQALRWVLDRALDERRPYLVLMLHSSELMPGGSPTCPHADDVEALYKDLDAFFGVAASVCRGGTLADVSREAREHVSA